MFNDASLTALINRINNTSINHALNILLARWGRITGRGTVVVGKRVVTIPEFGWNGYQNRWEVHHCISDAVLLVRALAGSIKANSTAMYQAIKVVRDDFRIKPQLFYFDVSYADGGVSSAADTIAMAGLIATIISLIAGVVEQVISFFNKKDAESVAPASEGEPPTQIVALPTILSEPAGSEATPATKWLLIGAAAYLAFAE